MCCNHQCCFFFQVSSGAALQWCEDIGAEYFEGSAKDDVDVEKTFLRAAQIALQQVTQLTLFAFKRKKTQNLFMFNMFIFLMIKDTLLPTVQKTHIGKYRTFPDNLQTAERNSQHLWVLRAALVPVWEGKVQRDLGTADDDLSNEGAKIVTQQRYCGRKGHNCIPHGERGTNSLNVFSFFENLQLMV